MRGWIRRARPVLVVSGIFIGLGVWYYAHRLAPVPSGSLRIGFEANPPLQVRTAGGYAGLAVETVKEAAKRAGLKLQAVETGTSSDQAFAKGLVGLLPAMGDLPDRRKRVRI